MHSVLPLEQPRRFAIYTLFIANAISMTGNNLMILAVPWFVLVTTGSPAKTGIAAFFMILPVVLAAFFGGAFVDRLGFKRSSIIADIASGVTIALIPLLFAAGLLAFWVLLVLVFLGALLDAPGTTAREALVPDLAGAAGMSLERASSLLQIVERGSRLLGAPLAGLLIAVLGAQNVLWIDAATFAVSAVLIIFTVPTVKIATAAPSGNYLTELTDGLRFIRRDRLILATTLTLIVTNLLDAAKSGVILPVFVRTTYGSAVALGLLFGVSGGGAVLGAILYSAFGHKFSRRWVFSIAFIIASLPALVFAWLPPLPLALITQAVGGFAAGPLNPILSTIQYERVPAPMRGRVFGTLTAGAYVAMPVGVLLAGYLLEKINLHWTLIAVGSCYLLATLSLLINPALRDMEG